MKGLIFIALAAMFMGCNNDSETKITIDTSGTERIDSMPRRIPDSTQTSSDVNTLSLPQNLTTFITDSLKGWNVPSDSSWDPYWYKQYKTDSSLVNFLSLDANCDGAKDYAMILSGPSNVTGAWIFLARGNGFTTHKLEQIENPSGQIGIGLSRFAKGNHAPIDLDAKNPKSKKVSCDGVTIEFFEKSAHSYYWENGKFNFMQTGD